MIRLKTQQEKQNSYCSNAKRFKECFFYDEENYLDFKEFGMRLMIVNQNYQNFVAKNKMCEWEFELKEWRIE